MNPTNYFTNEEYISQVFDSTKSADENLTLEKALKIAHDIRKFEIELFWKRGTYFWAFIVASFSAYFFVLNKFMPDCGKFSIPCFAGLNCFPKTILLILSFICFFFCFSWVLINKGSKFWQENWESHIDQLEDEITGKMYKAVLNKYCGKFKKNPFSIEPYDYSVTKITTFTSIFLTFLSIGLVVFHLYLIFYECIKCLKVEIILPIAIFVFFGYCIFKLLRCTGINENKSKKTDKKWFMRSK